jgi:hypothetical protein
MLSDRNKSCPTATSGPGSGIKRAADFSAPPSMTDDRRAASARRFGHRVVTRALLKNPTKFPAQRGCTAGTGADPALSGAATAALLAVLLAASAATGATPPSHSSIGALPATFAGVLPCADCRGIRYQLDLLPNSRFAESIQRLHGGDTQEIGVANGIWWITPEGRKLTLDAGSDVARRTCARSGR